MGRLVVTEFMSLDGVMADPHLWTFPYWNDEVAAFKSAEQDAAEVMLLGRVTYDGFATAWPERKEQDDFSRRFNEMEKRIATSTLTSFDWENSHRLDGDIQAGVAALKQRTSGDVIVHGSASVAQQVLRHGLVDELRIALYPVTRGEGKRLFDRVDVTLNLIEQTTARTGVLLLRYRPESAA